MSGASTPRLPKQWRIHRAYCRPAANYPPIDNANVYAGTPKAKIYFFRIAEYPRSWLFKLIVFYHTETQMSIVLQNYFAIQ